MEQAEGRLIRLMGLANVEVLRVGASVEARYHSKEHQIAREKGAPFIHWVTEGESIATEVVMPDASRAVGLAERLCSSLRVDDMIQFERFGFVRVDSVDPFVAYYAHN
jgi:glutamyl-tRNA synthetase